MLMKANTKRKFAQFFLYKQTSGNAEMGNLIKTFAGPVMATEDISCVPCCPFPVSPPSGQINIDSKVSGSHHTWASTKFLREQAGVYVGFWTEWVRVRFYLVAGKILRRKVFIFNLQYILHANG